MQCVMLCVNLSENNLCFALNEVLQEVLSQETSEIEAVKLLAIQVYLTKLAFFGNFDFDLL